MTGLLVLNKPSGPTSHDIVARVRRITGIRRVGHSGTLDPMASGVLLLCLGVATRLVEYLAELPKRYEAVAEFGVVTATQDLTGAVLETRDASRLRREDVERALEPFRGTIRQTPPMVSAVKHEGRRLYELARAGQEVERAARPVTIYELALREFSVGVRARSHLSILCSSGTYVRTLIHDLGEALGTGAAMAALARTAIGHFTLEAALTLEELEALAAEGRVGERLVPPGEIVAHLPAVAVPEGEVPRLLHGGDVSAAPVSDGPPSEGPVRLLTRDGELLAIGERAPGPGEARFAPVKVLRRADEAV